MTAITLSSANPAAQPRRVQQSFRAAQPRYSALLPLRYSAVTLGGGTLFPYEPLERRFRRVHGEILPQAIEKIGCNGAPLDTFAQVCHRFGGEAAAPHKHRGTEGPASIAVTVGCSSSAVTSVSRISSSSARSSPLPTRVCSLPRGLPSSCQPADARESPHRRHSVQSSVVKPIAEEREGDAAQVALA